jgi:RNA polymerase sigma-70 factor, ECF subfamily
MPTSVIALNRAIAVAEVEGPGPALVMIDGIAPDLENYHLLHAARGTILRRLGRREDARAAFERAADLAVTEADRRFLVKQIEVLTEDEVQPQGAAGGSIGSTNETGRR